MLFELFWAFFKVGCFSFGGGLAALPLIQQEIVEINGWLNLTEFTDLISIAQMTPGPIAINASTFVGLRLSGFLGAIVATIGCITPALIIISILAYIYYRFKNLVVIQAILKSLRPAVVALIASAGFSIIKLALLTKGNSINYIGLALFVSALFILRKYKLNPILVLILSGVIGGFLYALPSII